jgi:hypothetical protein
MANDADADPDKEVVPMLAREHAPHSVAPSHRPNDSSDSDSSDDDDSGDGARDSDAEDSSSQDEGSDDDDAQVRLARLFATAQSPRRSLQKWLRPHGFAGRPSDVGGRCVGEREVRRVGAVGRYVAFLAQPCPLSMLPRGRALTGAYGAPGVEFVGEVCADFLGLNDSQYQWIIDEQRRREEDVSFPHASLSLYARNPSSPLQRQRRRRLRRLRALREARESKVMTDMEGGGDSEEPTSSQAIAAEQADVS